MREVDGGGYGAGDWPGGCGCGVRAGGCWSSVGSERDAYDSATGLLTQEVVEPGTPALRLETDTVYERASIR